MNVLDLPNSKQVQQSDQTHRELSCRFKAPDCVRSQTASRTPLALKKYEVQLIETFQKDLSNTNQKKANFRLLPYPFLGYLTIASDCDSPRLEAFLGVGKKIREYFSLPISDSFFPNWLYRQGLNSEQNFDIEKFETKLFDWLRLFHAGGIDSIHGWFMRVRIMIADSLLLCSPLFSLKKNRYKEIFRHHNISSDHTRFPNKRSRLVTFTTPPGWHAKDPPRYLIFKLYMPLEKSKLDIKFIAKNSVIGSKEVFVNTSCLSRQSPSEILIDMTELFNVKEVDFNQFKIRFTHMGYGMAYIGNPALYSNTRAEILAQEKLLERYNLYADVYTSHGGGYDIGRRTVIKTSSADPRVIAELPTSPTFGMDLFKNSGLKFYNTANNTSCAYLNAINTLVNSYVLNSNEVVMDFNRFLCDMPPVELATNKEIAWEVNGEASNPSLADFIGRQIACALGGINQLGDGAIIYTHTFSRHPSLKNRFNFEPDNIFNDETNLALKELQDRYYNLSGDRSDKERLFVAPTSSILKLSRLLQHCANHIFYDEDSNEILIEKFKDPLSETTVPNRNYQGSDLAGLTVYVNNSGTAKAKSQDGIIQGLIRNPADETGRESVTFADISSPTIIIGLVPLPKRDPYQFMLNGLSCQNYANQFCIEDNNATLTIIPENVSWSHHHSLLFNASADHDITSFRLDLWSEEGHQFSIADKDYPDCTNAWIIPPNQLQRNQTIVIPFHFLTTVKKGNSLVPPRGKLVQVMLHIQAKQGANLTINQLSFLRNTIGMLQSELLLGGKVDKDIQAKKIVLETHEFGKISTQVKENNSYIFPFKVKRGAVVRIYAICKDDSQVYPKDGPLHEIWANRLDIDF